MKKYLISTLVILMIMGFCELKAKEAKKAKEKEEKVPFALEKLPDWVDRYAKFNASDMSFFKISELCKHYKISRLQAVELQNHFRDLTCAGMNSLKAFRKALEKVKKFDFESGLSPKKIEKAPFIIVIDVDETLLDQRYKSWKKGKKYYDYMVKFKNGKSKGISFAPGWKKLMKRVKELKGLFIIFSANKDDTIWSIVNTVKVGKKSLAQATDGVMTNSYLTMQSKYEGSRMRPIANPSKDLRNIDSRLSKTIIIDDNPKRIVQHNRLRLTKKYHADKYYSNPIAKKAYEKQLEIVLGEIEESLAYSKKYKISFANAYLPYTQLGNVVIKWLVETKLFTRKKAIDFIRKNPRFVDSKF